MNFAETIDTDYWKEVALTAWLAPSWREAAIEYHKARGDRRTVVEIDPERLVRLRRLLLKEVSFERAYHEILADRIRGRTSEAVVEALVFSLRRGVNELARPDAKRRLSELSDGQLREVCKRLLSFKPEIATPWTPQEIEAICAIWDELK
jgi:hypothetical protein